MVEAYQSLDKLLNIDQSDVQSYAAIVSSDFNDKTKESFFIRSLLLGCKLRPMKIGLFGEVIISICELDQVNHMKSYILEYIFRSLRSDLTISSQCSILALLRYLFEKNFYSIQQIISQFDVVGQNNAEIRRELILMFYWFAPEIDGQYPQLFSEMLPTMLKYHNDESFGRAANDITSNFQQLQENDWELLKKYLAEGHNAESLSAALKFDNVDLLRKYASSPSFNINEQLPPSFFEPSWFVQNEPSLLAFAAYFGSLKCFTYLTSCHASMLNVGRMGSLLSHYAVAGGNLEIVRLCEQGGCDFTGSLHVAAAFSRPEIFFWIQQTMFKTIDDDEYIEIFANAAESNCYPILEFCLSNWSRINDLNYDGMNALHNVAKNGNLECLIFLSKLDEIDMNKTSRENLTALHYAAKHNRAEVIEFLLGLEVVNVNAASKNGQTPLSLAAEMGNNEAVKLFLSCKRVDINETNMWVLSYLMEQHLFTWQHGMVLLKLALFY